MIALAVLLMIGSAGVEVYHWTQPPRSHAEELATATATSEPPTATSEPATALPIGSPTLTPLPTLAITDPPLTLDPWATVTSVRRGDQFSYIITVGSSSESVRTIEVHNSLNNQLDILEAGASTGTCTLTNPVVCTLTASKSAPAQITINVRVHTNAALGSLLVSQTLARDDQRVTVASERVTVTVLSALRQVDAPTTAPATMAPVVPPTRTPKPARSAAQPAATSTPAGPTATVQTEQTTSTPEVVAAGGDQPTATLEATQTPPAPSDARATAAAHSLATPALPPTLEPAAPQSSAKPGQSTDGGTSNVLPDTAATTPLFGIGIGLLGFALTLHGARRVRHADTRLTGASAAIARLAPLVAQANEFQAATVSEIERMRNESAAMIDAITRKQRGS